MKILIDTNPGNRLFSQRQFLFFLIVNICFIISCTNKPEPFSILEFSGKGEVTNYSQSWITVSYSADSINNAYLPAHPGDLLSVDDNLFYYMDPSKNKLSFYTDKNFGYINGKIYSIDIPEDDSMISWLEQMKPSDISELGYISFSSKIPDSYFPYLAEMVKNKPDIGIAFTKLPDQWERIFKMFNPRFIFGQSLPTESFNLMSGMTNLEMVTAGIEDSLILSPLPQIPSLKYLVLITEDITPHNNLFVNNKQLEQLSVFELKRFDCAVLKPLAGLKELIVMAEDTIINFEQVKNLKNLEVLSVSSDNFRYDLKPEDFPGIRWMTFASASTQEDFDSFIGSHPDLEIVELINNEELKSLQPLLKLKKLYGLTVAHSIADSTTIFSMTNLRYLSLPKEFLKNSTKKAELQKSLPGTRIVQNHGVCLGSGWLLLLIPLILIFRIAMRQKNIRSQDSI